MELSNSDWLAVGSFLAIVVLAAVYMHFSSGTRARLGRRLDDVSSNAPNVAGPAVPGGAGKGAMLRLLQRIGGAVPLFDAAQRSEIGRKLVSAGYRQPGAMPTLIGLSIGCAALGVVLMMALVWPKLEGNTALRILALLAGAYVGLLLPRLVVDRLVMRRQRAIERAFPDALDLLVVCTNAGLGLNSALQRVAEELEYLAPELSDELTLTSGQLQLSGDAAQVLRELADRIGLQSIRSLVSTLIQSRQFGTPIGQALRVLSRGERTARLMRTEEAAAKLPTKITVPMMLFILPTVLIVAGGPAVLILMKSLSQH